MRLRIYVLHLEFSGANRVPHSCAAELSDLIVREPTLLPIVWLSRTTQYLKFLIRSLRVALRLLEELHHLRQLIAAGMRIYLAFRQLQ